MKKKIVSYTSILGFIKGTPLIVITVPFDSLSVRKILSALHPEESWPKTYKDIYQSVGFKGLWKGTFPRTTYALSSTASSVAGIHLFGSDFTGMTFTSLAKNGLLPLSLFSNARQAGLTWKDTLKFVRNGCVSPVVHGSFFFRNWIGCIGLMPGLQLTTHLKIKWGKDYEPVALATGYAVSVGTLTLLNTWFKPLFTGASPWPKPFFVACKLPGLLPIMAREACSLAVIFSSLNLEK